MKCYTSVYARIKVSWLSLSPSPLSLSHCLYLSVSASLSLPLYFFVTASLPVCLSVSLCFCLCLSLPLTVCSYVFLPLSACLPVCLSLSVCLSLFPSLFSELSATRDKLLQNTRKSRRLTSSASLLSEKEGTGGGLNFQGPKENLRETRKLYWDNQSSDSSSGIRGLNSRAGHAAQARTNNEFSETLSSYTLFVRTRQPTMRQHKQTTTEVKHFLVMHSLSELNSQTELEPTEKKSEVRDSPVYTISVWTRQPHCTRTGEKMIGLRHSPVIHFLSEFDDHAVLEQSTSGVRRSPVTHAKSALEQTENK